MTQEPYSRKTYRVPFLLDVAAENEAQAFSRINAVVRVLGDREDKSLTQVGYEAERARRPIMGATVYIDQLRQVVEPAIAYPLPTIAELIEAATPPIYRNADQLAFADTGRSAEVKTGRRSAAD